MTQDIVQEKNPPNHDAERLLMLQMLYKHAAANNKKLIVCGIFGFSRESITPPQVIIMTDTPIHGITEDSILAEFTYDAHTDKPRQEIEKLYPCTPEDDDTFGQPLTFIIE